MRQLPATGAPARAAPPSTARSPRTVLLLLDRRVGVLVIPVTPADLLALHRPHPVLHLDRGDGALLPGLFGHARRHAGGAGGHAFRPSTSSPACRRGRGGGGAGRRALRADLRLRLPVVGLGVHRIRLLPDLRAGRAAALADPHRLADRRRRLAAVPVGERMRGRASRRSCGAGA